MRMTAVLRAGLHHGLIAGGIVAFVALVGMVDAFARIGVIDGAVDLSQVVWLGAVGLVGASAARATTARGREAPSPRAASLASGLAGVVAGVAVAALIALGSAIDLNVVFEKARPALFARLTLGNAWGTVAACAAAGLAGGLVAALPTRVRGAIAAGLASVLILGIAKDLMTKIDVVKRIDWVGDLNAMLYGRGGLTVGGAAAIMAVAMLWRWVAPPARAAFQARLRGLPAKEQSTARRTLRVLGLTALVLLVAWFPLGFGRLPAEVADLVGIYILMGLGLNIVVGFAGLLDLGYVAFFAIGAYVTGILTSTNANVPVQIGWSFWEAVPIAVALAVLAGIVLGVPVLKTHGDYLAIITLGFGEIIRILAISDWLKPLMGGAQGVTLIPKPLEVGAVAVPAIGRVDPNIQQELFYVIVAACLIALYVAWRLRDSRYGRAWMALREDEDVAQAMGIDLVTTKLLAFATGAGFAGLAGALFAAKIGSIYPSSFGLLVSINVLVLIIVGGMGSIPGVFVGALALVGLPELLRELDDFRLLIYGAVLVWMMLKRPEGLWPAAVVRRELAHGRRSDGAP